MAGTVTWERLRELAAFRAEKGCAISLYLNLDPSVAPTEADAQTRINSLLDEGARSERGNRGDLTHEQKQGLKADFERIRAYFEDEFDRDGARGVAIFSAGLDNLWRTIQLADPIPDEIKLASAFYLAPLVPLLGRGEGALVAVVGREQGRVFRLSGGRLVEIADESEEQPGQHDQGGWSQARYQRHIENLVQDHFKSVGETLDRRLRRLDDPQLVLVCAEEMRSGVEAALSSIARGAIVGWTQAEAHAGAAELLAAALPLLEESRAQCDREALDRWKEEAGRSGRAASGWAQTLEAASDGRVELLLFQEGADRPAYECPACGRATSADGSCPLDGTRLEEASAGLDLAVHQTLAHGGTIRAVTAHQDLQPVEGIAAVLRY